MTELRVRNKLDYFDRTIMDLNRKIQNASGWWTESHIEKFKKERWDHKRQKEEFYDNHVEYLL